MCSEQDEHPATQDILHMIPSVGKTVVPLSQLCDELSRSTQAEGATVTSIVRYSGKGSLSHRFVLLAGERNGHEFWIRLDRRPNTQSTFRLLFSPPDGGAKDANLALNQAHVLEDQEKMEAQVHFPTPIPLKSFGTVLNIIRDGSTLYGLRKENCWFFSSVIQEISIQFFGGSFRRLDRLNHPTLSYPLRKAIKARMYAMHPPPIATSIKDLESLALMTHDPKIRTVFVNLARVTEIQAVSGASHCSALHRHRDQLNYSEASALLQRR
ncbi:uncharacterized protein EI90DRAFT_1573590 [Cantharellus anzutake]|uniref:uncharacterized protein n=1 Tax=Cantharellus anzutake TaxID=1750568 RepID=UPI0019082531|nr:uncharacterized protein EI90DRAFT_1573590 [Cantharellus anzutake]KAF8328411.1 hypothetical protein EI90DRAFT_1573590 [Cantharellus anzutake]